MHKTTVILREMSADEQIREEARRREKRLHDEATALNCQEENKNETDYCRVTVYFFRYDIVCGSTNECFG